MGSGRNKAEAHGSQQGYLVKNFGSPLSTHHFANNTYRFFLSIRPPAYKTMVLYTGKNSVYKTMVLYCTIFLELGIRVPNIQF